MFILNREIPLNLNFFIMSKEICEEFCLIGYVAVVSRESQPTFQGNLSPPLSTDYVALCPRRQNSSLSPTMGI
jgi:hypothetical protein